MQAAYEGYGTPQFNPNFKIPIKNQPPPPGTENNARTLQTPNMFNSPLFAGDPQAAWAPTFSGPAPEMPSLPTKRKPDYMPPDDSDLPDELKKKFQALHCLLCDAKMNSPISAKMHYESKQHDKKVHNWLSEWAKQTGAPMPKRQRKVQNNVEGPKGPNAFFCEHCQIPLTSVQHANQHYMGKRHRMVAAGKMCPKGSGYYDKDGKWIKQNKAVNDLTGRFGIGTSFLPPEVLAPPPPPPPPEERAAQLAAAADKSKLVNTGDRHCKICDVTVTSAQQMETHLAGSKHMKNCKKLGTPVPPPQPLHDNDTVLESYGSNAAKYTIQDFSIYRTPSGMFYCNICNMTAPNEGVFSSHIVSKKHIKMAKEKR